MVSLKGIIFVVGASRSGTTMLNRILGQHSSVNAMNELHYFGDLFDLHKKQLNLSRQQQTMMISKLFARYRRGIWNDSIQEFDLTSANNLLINLPDTINGAELFHYFIEYVASENGSLFVSEQTPRNIYYAADILKTYPDAKVLHIIRDPRAVIASQKMRWSRRKKLNAKNIPLLEMIRERISYHPYTMSLLWKKAYLSSQSIEKNNRYKRIRFEDLVNKPNEVLKSVCGFLDIPFETNMLKIPQIDSSVRAADNTAIGIQKTAVDTWKTILSAREVPLIEKQLSREMKELDYDVQQSKTFLTYFTLLPVLLSFPFHLIGTILINPKKFFIQLKGISKK